MYGLSGDGSEELESAQKDLYKYINRMPLNLGTAFAS